MTLRPTIGEQLAGIKRVLETVVAPALPPGYPAEMLRWSAEALARLARQQGLDEANLRWELTATSALLERVAAMPGYVEPPAAAPATAKDEFPAAGLTELQAEVLAARSRLADLVRSLAFQPGTEALTAELLAHVRACAAQPW
jgi:hypothetical protein